VVALPVSTDAFRAFVPGDRQLARLRTGFFRTGGDMVEVEISGIGSLRNVVTGQASAAEGEHAGERGDGKVAAP